MGLRALYRQVFDAEQQLLTVGFCLFAELLETHFFTAMQRVLHDAWPDLGASIALLDFHHLDALRHVPVPTNSSRASYTNAACSCPRSVAPSGTICARRYRWWRI
jgi:hypothetical protein